MRWGSTTHPPVPAWLAIATTAAVAIGVACGPAGSDAVELANGSHIWGQVERGDTNKLHLRGPNTYDAARATGSYSQINLYATHVGIWGGTQPGGHAVYLDQQALYPREAGTLDLRGWRSVQATGLAGSGRRYACIDPDGSIVASLAPCVGAPEE